MIRSVLSAGLCLCLGSSVFAEVYLLPNGTVVDTDAGLHYLENGIVNLRDQDYEWLRDNGSTLPTFGSVDEAKQNSPMFGGSSSEASSEQGYYSGESSVDSPAPGEDLTPNGPYGDDCRDGRPGPEAC